MPDVLLKDRNGNTIEYTDVNTITVPSTTPGETVTFNFTQPGPTPMWYVLQEFLKSNAVMYTCEVGGGLLVSSPITDFGIYYVSDSDAVEVYPTGSGWQYFQPIEGGCLWWRHRNSML